MDQQPSPTYATTTQIDGHVALVTGASGGLGRRFAAVLAAAGASVAVVGRRGDRLAQACGEIEKEGGRAFPLAADVARVGEAPRVFDAIEAELGRVTILINNAGVSDARYATKMSEELVDAVIGTNLKAPWTFSCEAARRLIAAKSPGRIVNITSMSAFHYAGDAPSTLYSTTKAALVRMTEVLAVEWARFGINVNAIAPGAFHSEMMDGMVERVGDFFTAFPRGRLSDAHELDSTLLYLVGPASSAVTGTIVKVDDAQGPR